MNFFINKRKILGVLAVALVLFFTGCGSEETKKIQTGEDLSLQKVMDAKKLVLGSDAGFPPMGFTDENGEIIGFDVDVAKEVCKRMEIELVTKDIDWGEKEEELNSGKIDCIWSGMSVTPERAKEMNLSESYMRNELIFVIPGDSEAKGTQDLEGKKVGVHANSTSLETLKQLDLKLEIVECPGETALFNELSCGNLDAVLVDSVGAYYFLATADKTYYVLPESQKEEEYAIGFRKKDKKLRDTIQEHLGKMKEDGTLGEISRKWFGSDITIVR